MSILGENTAVRMGLAIGACCAVAMISYQQGQIQANVPKEGQYVTSAVFAATMAGVESKLSALKDTVDAKIGSLSDAQDLRLKLVEAELGRLREDIIRVNGEKNVPAAR